MSGCQGQKGRSFQRRRQARLVTFATSVPAPLSTPASGTVLSPVPRTLPPTFFPFLASYSMVDRLLCSCHPPGHPRQTPPLPFPLFSFLPGRKLHQPQSSCPSHLTVGVGGRRRTLPWDPITEGWGPKMASRGLGSWSRLREIPFGSSPCVCHRLCWVTLEPAACFSVYTRRKPGLSLRNE